jgi:predicted GIY-YIG superfamily endonuclease
VIAFIALSTVLKMGLIHFPITDPSKYGCKILAYYEVGDSMEGAVLREKQIKAGSRLKKIQLIESINPGWQDLYELISK